MDKKKIQLPRSVTYILIAIVIILPTVLAVATIIYLDSNDNADMSRVSEVILLDSSSGEELFREHSSEELMGDTSLIGIFSSLYHGLEQISFIPDELSPRSHITVKILDNDVSHTYDCMFPLDGSPAYCTDENGAHYSIKESDTARFLSSYFSQSLYPSAAVPTVQTNDGDLILPQSVSWNYKNATNEYVPVHAPDLTADVLEYSISGGLAFDFSIAPDISTVSVYQSGNLLFAGSIDDLDTVAMGETEEIHVTLRAEWYQTDERKYYGVLEYDFNASIHSRAEFFISDTTLSAGEFTTVTATNISNISRLKFTAEDSNFSPKIMLNGTTAYIFIPHAAAEGKSHFDFTVSYGVTSQVFSVSTWDDGATSHEKDIRWSLKIFDINLQQSFANPAEYIFRDGIITEPDVSRFEKVLSYGESISYKNEQLTSCFTSYRSYAAGDTVAAVSGGKVVEVDKSTNLGKYVVVDMGGGLYMRYYHLSITEAEVGDYIAAGDVIGKCGTLTGDLGEGFSLMLSCNGYAVDSQMLFD